MALVPFDPTKRIHIMHLDSCASSLSPFNVDSMLQQLLVENVSLDNRQGLARQEQLHLSLLVRKRNFKFVQAFFFFFNFACISQTSLTSRKSGSDKELGGRVLLIRKLRTTMLLCLMRLLNVVKLQSEQSMMTTPHHDIIWSRLELQACLEVLRYA